MIIIIVGMVMLAALGLPVIFRKCLGVTLLCSVLVADSPLVFIS